MRAKIILCLLVVLSLLFYCQKEKSTEPVPDNGLHPQVDLPWPSLADSPWPIANGNVQRTGRSRFQGPQQGIIEWTYPDEGQYLMENNSSAVIGEDGTIYFTTNRHLHALRPDGSLKWKFTPDRMMGGSPMIGIGDIIYVCAGEAIGSSVYNGCYYALQNDGSIIWEFLTQEGLFGYGDAIGLDGSIYFTGAEGTLYALNKDGTLKFKTKGVGGFISGRSSIAVSPDGLTLYVSGLDSTLNAIDAHTSSINWRFFRGENFNNANHMVDCEGNIYSYAKEQGEYTIISLTAKGELRWEFKHGVLNDFNATCDMHLDKNGNIYFSTNTKFCSLDYDGNLRWSVLFKGQSPTGAILGDVDGIIYFGWDYLLAYNQNGNKKFECNLRFPLVAGAISDNKSLYVCAEPKFYCIK
mgnify:CR=1 FL=1